MERLFRTRLQLPWLLLCCAIACEPPVAVDAPPTDLDIEMAVEDTEDPPPAQGVLVLISFRQGNKTVILASGTTLICNGVTIPLWAGVSYVARVPAVAVGGTYNCVYTRGGTSATVTATVPSRPVITSPAAGATISRSPSVTITYVGGGGVEVSGSVHGFRATAGSVSHAAGAKPDNGTYTGLDASSFDPGAGSVGLNRKLVTMPGGTGFHAATITYSTGADRSVTWN